MANDLKSKFEKEIKEVYGENTPVTKTIIEIFNKVSKGNKTKIKTTKGLLKHIIKCNCNNCKNKPYLQKYLMLDEYKRGEYAFELQEQHGSIRRMFVGLPELNELRKTLDNIFTTKIN